MTNCLSLPGPDWLLGPVPFSANGREDLEKKNHKKGSHAYFCAAAQGSDPECSRYRETIL